MKDVFCLSLRSVTAIAGATLLLTSCREETLHGFPKEFLWPSFIFCIGILLLAGCLLGRCLREQKALRNDKEHLASLVAEQKKALAVYRHQADWKQHEDAALLIRKKERLAACLVAQLEMVKQRKLACGPAVSFTETEWEELIPLIDVAYDDFTLRLRKAYPALTADALRFCCLLKIGFSVEETARLLSVTKDAVYKRRSRLKKEVLHGHDSQSLEEFLADF